MRNAILVLLFSGISFLQAQTNGRICDTLTGIDKMFGSRLLAKTYVNINGTNSKQYYNNWSDGEVKLVNGDIVKNELLRYNLLLDELLWLRKIDYSTGMVYKNTVEEFTLFNDSSASIARFRKVMLGSWYSSDSAYTYLQVLAEGEVSLFVQRKVINISNSTNELKAKNKYYIEVDGVYSGFAPNLSAFCATLKDDKKKMKSIVHTNHLNIRNESELIEAIEIYNGSFITVE
jgi:hypothetical protein